jgi:hypothetical protein
MNDITDPPATFDLEKRVGQYVKLRDHIKALKAKHEEELAKPNALLENLNGILIDYLNKNNTLSARTAAGTVGRRTKRNTTISDKSAFWTYVVTQGDFDMIDYKANPNSVEQYILKQAERAKTDPTVEVGPPPGVNYSVRYEAGVTRS